MRVLFIFASLIALAAISVSGQSKGNFTGHTERPLRYSPQGTDFVIENGKEFFNRPLRDGRPYIATYWRPQGTKIPQYHVIYHAGTQWQTTQVTNRKTPFSLGGRGTRRIPISRPQIVVNSKRGKLEVVMIFRDSERGNRVSIAVCADLEGGVWTISDLTNESVGMWEPTYDPVLWSKTKELHLFVQMVGQGEGEQLESVPAQMVSILEWRPTLAGSR